MARVQQVEAAVGEDDAPPVALFLRHVENQLVPSQDAAHSAILKLRPWLDAFVAINPLIFILSRAILPPHEPQMNRRPRIALLLGLLCLGCGVWLSAVRPFFIRDVIVPAGDCRIPVRVIEPRIPNPTGSVIVLHGISANRGIMQYLGESFAAAGLRAFLVDLPGHGDSSDPFSSSRAEVCTAGLLRELARRSEILPSRTIIVGHSMGGAIAIRVARHFSAAATIAISPAPMGDAGPLPRGFVLFDRPERSPTNLLLLRGALEPRALDANDRSLLAVAGGEHTSVEDFRLGRAAHLEILPGATHTSLLYSRRVARTSLEWIRHVLAIQDVGDRSAGLHAAGGLIGFFGLILLFPAAVRATHLFSAPSAPSKLPVARPVMLLLAVTALSAVFSVLVLLFWNPLQPLHMVTADYLAGSMLVAGLAVLFIFRKDVRALLRFESAALLRACFFGLATVVLFGLWVNWHLTDAWMSPGRWLRFVPLVLVLLPYQAAEEFLLALLPRQTFTLRVIFFLALRVILWLAWIGALFFLQSGQILLLLLAPFLIVLSLLQRLATETVLHTTASRSAAALYGGILGAWLLAASLPLT